MTRVGGHHGSAKLDALCLASDHAGRGDGIETEDVRDPHRGEAARLEVPRACYETFEAEPLRAASDHWSSITVDRREGRPMEWEVRNAVIGRLGRAHGIETPMNDAITALLKAADSGRP